MHGRCHWHHLLWTVSPQTFGSRNCARAFTIHSAGHAGCTELGEDGELALYNPRSGGRKQFKYDRVFGSGSTQEEVYEDTKALIRSVLDGE